MPRSIFENENENKKSRKKDEDEVNSRMFPSVWSFIVWYDNTKH